MTAQVAAMVEVLKTRDEMSVATDEIIQNLSDLMMQLDFARNRMLEGVDQVKLDRMAPLYVELASKINDVSQTVVSVAVVVQSK